MSFPRAKRFTEPKVCGPGVGTYTPTEKPRALCAKFLAADRFKDDTGSVGSSSTSGSPFRHPLTPIHLPKDKLRRKMAELLQQLEDRDRLISQLQMSKNKLSAHIGQLEGRLRSIKKRTEKSMRDATSAASTRQPGLARAADEFFTEADTLAKDATEGTTELRLTKDTQELREELRIFVDGFEDDMYCEDLEQDRGDREEEFATERRYKEPLNDEMQEQLNNFKTAISVLQLERDAIQKQQESLQNQMTVWQTEQSALAHQQTELAARLQQDLDDASNSVSLLKKTLDVKDKEVSEVSKMLEQERTKQAQATAISLQLGEDLEELLSLKVSLESELAETKAQLEESVVDRAAAEGLFLQAQDTITELEEQLFHASEKEDSVVTELAALRTVNLQLGENLEKLMSLKVSLESELAEAKAQLEESVVDRASAEGVFLQAQDTITQLEEQLLHASEKEGSLVTELAAVRTVNLQLGEDLEKLMSLKASLESELAMVKIEHEESAVDRAAAEDIFLQAQDTITELKEQLSCAFEKEESLVAELIALKGYLAALQTEKQELEEDLALVGKNTNQLSAETSKLESELCTLRSDKSLLEARVTDLVAEKEQLQKEVLIQADRADVALAEGRKLTENLRSLKKEQLLLENLQAQAQAAQEQVVTLQAEKEQLKNESVALQQELANALSDLSASYGREQETGERLHSATLELEVERTCIGTLRAEIAARVEALTELQVSHEQTLGELQQAKYRQAETASRLECALKELHTIATERTDLVKAHDDLRRTCDLKTEQIAALEKKAKKYVVVSRELEKENLQLCADLQNSRESNHMEVSELQKRLQDSSAEAQRWKNDYEVLQARIAPFQLQLELYDVERRHLAERNQATESELSKLHQKFSELMGHQNHKQKIHYLAKVTEERQQYQAEVLRLQEQNLKQMKLIQKLELEVKRCSLKPPLTSQKENLFPKDSYA